MTCIFYALQFSTLFFFELLIIIPFTNGYISNYTLCSTTPFNCGKIQNVTYPFWGGDRPEFCGHTEFGLTCQNGTTFIYRMGTTVSTDGSENGSVYARVVSIDASSHTMSLVLSPFAYDSIFCEYLIKNETVINLSAPFKFTPLVTNISLFFGCNTLSTFHRTNINSFACNNSINGTDFAYYFDRPADVDKLGKSCNTRRVVPVLKSELNELSKGRANLREVLDKGFEVEYKVVFNGCLACQNSGGFCGSTDNNGSSENISLSFVCYCRDGGHPQVCPNTPKPASIRPSKMVIIISVSGSLASVILAVTALIFCTKKQLLVNKFPILGIRGIRENQNVEAFLKSYGSLAPKRYRYKNIKKITNSFKEKLGEGGFGSVYKGKLRDGRLVAVKLLDKMKGNGEDFINEVLSISRTNHVNVVTLLGFCLEGNKRALIYEYLANGSLDKFIYGAQSQPSLQWETMFKIAVGIARGLDYLHRGCNTRILHFDIKPHNVLLDGEFCPKISDFGLAKLCPTKDSTISMLEARGTIGYIAPEVFYRSFGGVSHKSDVYSYGMMVLEMACGRANLSTEVQRSSEMYFPEWIFNRLERRHEYAELNEKEEEIQRKMILVSLWCIQTFPSNRPSMNRVLEMIEGPLESLPMPPRATVYIWGEDPVEL